MTPDDQEKLIETSTSAVTNRSEPDNRSPAPRKSNLRRLWTENKCFKSVEAVEVDPKFMGIAMSRSPIATAPVGRLQSRF